MNKKCFAIVLIAALWPALSLAQGQQGIASNPLGGNITATSSNCATVQSCVWQQLPNNAGTTTINLAGTFTATLLVEESNNGGGTWATAATLSATGTTTYSTNGFTDIRVRASAFTSGPVQVSISTGLQSGPGGGGGGGAVASVFGRTGAVVAAANDYSVSQLSGLPVTAPQGGTGVASPAAHSIPVAEGASNYAFVASPTANGDYGCIFHVTGAAAVDPTCPQVGQGGRSITGAATTDPSFGFADNLTVITHDKAASGAVNQTLPTATTLGNANFAYTYCNHSAQTDTITPTTWTIQAGNVAAGATLSVASGVCYRIKVDPNSVTNWLADQTGVTGGASTFDSTSIGQPTNNASWTFPAAFGFTLSGTAPASVSTTPGTNAVSNLTINGIAGGASSNAAGVGGVGSSPAVAAGTGGAGTGTNATGGVGGSITLTSGGGGASAGTSANSNGGGVTIFLGNPGTGGSGAAGTWTPARILGGSTGDGGNLFQICTNSAGACGTEFFHVTGGTGNLFVKNIVSAGGGIVIGSSGSGTTISAVIGGSAALTYTAIAAQTCQEQTLAVSGATVGKAAFFSPGATLGNTNLSWSSWVSASNTVSVRVCNPTAGSITPSAVTWNGWVQQ